MADDPLSSTNRLLDSRAIRPDFELNPKVFATATSSLLTAVGFFLGKQAGKLYLALNRAALSALAEVVASVQQWQHVDDGIAQVEKAIQQLSIEVEGYTKAINSIPDGPFANEGPAAKLLLIIMASDPKLSVLVKERRDAYVRTVQSANQAVSDFYTAAADLDRQLKADVSNLAQVVDALKPANNVQIVLKGEYRQRVQFLQLAVETRLQQSLASLLRARRRVEDLAANN